MLTGVVPNVSVVWPSLVIRSSVVGLAIFAGALAEQHHKQPGDLVAGFMPLVVEEGAEPAPLYGRLRADADDLRPAIHSADAVLSHSDSAGSMWRG